MASGAIYHRLARDDDEYLQLVRSKIDDLWLWSADGTQWGAELGGSLAGTPPFGSYSLGATLDRLFESGLEQPGRLRFAYATPADADSLERLDRPVPALLYVVKDAWLVSPDQQS